MQPRGHPSLFGRCHATRPGPVRRYGERVRGAVSWYAMAAAAYGGFQWTVHVVLYRQFPLVPADRFPSYARGHRLRVAAIVGPLFLFLGASAAVLAATTGVPAAGRAGAPLLYATLLAVTFAGALPQHRRLARGWDAPAYAALLRWDAVRLLLATAQAGLAAWLLLGPGAA